MKAGRLSGGLRFFNVGANRASGPKILLAQHPTCPVLLFLQILIQLDRAHGVGERAFANLLRLASGFCFCVPTLHFTIHYSLFTISSKSAGSNSSATGFSSGRERTAFIISSEANPMRIKLWHRE